MSDSAQSPVLITRQMPPNVAERAERSFAVKRFDRDVVRPMSEIIEAAQGQSAIICCSSEQFTAEALAQLPESVRIISTFSVGYEHIDVPAARERGITVTNTPDVLTDATADITVLCMLGAARRAYEGQRLVRAGQWVGWNTTMLLGTHMSGKRLGIYGMGRIGQAVARRAKGFGMEVHYHNRSRVAPELEFGATYQEDVDQFLSVSQFLAINAPLTPQTAGFLNAENIAKLPDGAVVVNTARGGLVDDDALLEALASGKVSAAGLDVFNGEPKLNERYLERDNAYLLPHLGSATVETRDAMGFCCLDNVDAFFAGRDCPNALER
jgi:lactate dehydrogenase-like 2-hydroxyacid dehydrogenase